MGRRDGIAPNPFVSGTHTHCALVCKRGCRGQVGKGGKEAPCLSGSATPSVVVGLIFCTFFSKIECA